MMRCIDTDQLTTVRDFSLQRKQKWEEEVGPGSSERGVSGSSCALVQWVRFVAKSAVLKDTNNLW